MTEGFFCQATQHIHYSRQRIKAAAFMVEGAFHFYGGRGFS